MTSELAHAIHTNAGRLLLLSLVPLGGATLVSALDRHRICDLPSMPSERISVRLDPNGAPWWELSVLPRVGESLARRIVAYRETKAAAGFGRRKGDANRAAFRTIEDLDAVRGIGPATLSHIRPHLAIMPVHEANGGD